MALMTVTKHNEQGKDHRSQPRWSAGKKTEAVLRLLRAHGLLARSGRAGGVVRGRTTARSSPSGPSRAGAPSAAAWSWSSGWRWPTPPSSAAGSSAAPDPLPLGWPTPPQAVTTYWRRT